MLWIIPALLAAVLPAPALAAPLSGPQPGERLLPFSVRDLSGDGAGRVFPLEFRPDTPHLTLFIHGLERSILPLLRAVDAYASRSKDRLVVRYVLLPADPVDAERRLPLINRSLRLHSPLLMSVDGIEGPGSYGLSKEVLMTILVSRGDRALHNYALVQPGIVDGDAILRDLARLLGDPNPPAAASLLERSGRPAPASGTPPVQPVDLSRYDLNTLEGLRAALQALQAENTSLRRLLAERTPPAPGR